MTEQGYQWVLGDPITDYTAHGVYNQFIYVDPESGIVIAKHHLTQI